MFHYFSFNCKLLSLFLATISYLPTHTKYHQIQISYHRSCGYYVDVSDVICSRARRIFINPGPHYNGIKRRSGLRRSEEENQFELLQTVSDAC